MHLAVPVIGNSNVINTVVAVKVEIVDPVIPVVETSLERLKSHGIAEQVHYSVKIEVVTRETQVFLREVLAADCCHCCQDCEDRCDN